jgi:cyclohexa-1,5-dienecarbonyl-CoA hydratase
MTPALDSHYDRLAIQSNSFVVRITLRKPPLNVIDLAMMDDLLQALADIDSSPQISVIVIRGDGESFSAGVDVAAHTPDQVEAMLSSFHAVIRALVSSSKVTLASVRGNCLGGGAELAMVCDLVYTATSARWGFPEINLGCFPPVACAALSGLVGQKRAAELILTGRAVGGDEAVAMGLANHAVPESELDAAVDQAVHTLSNLSPAALRITKKAIYSWDAMHFDKGLARAEKIYLAELMRTADAHEGISAFMEKRPAQWSGK